jgi:hypothetical protein
MLFNLISICLVLEFHLLVLTLFGTFIRTMSCGFFVIESSFYILAWIVSRYDKDNKHLKPFHRDYNIWANILLFIVALGYFINSIFYIKEIYITTYEDGNTTYGALLCVIGVLYLFGILNGEHSRSPVRSATNNCIFRSKFDWYLFATLFFFFGSLFNFIAAVLEYYDVDGIAVDDRFFNLATSIVYLVGAPIYIISGFQDRCEEEIPFSSRMYYFFIEFQSHHEPVATTAYQERRPLLQASIL